MHNPLCHIHPSNMRSLIRPLSFLYNQTRFSSVKPYVKGLRRTEFTNKLEVIRDSQVIPIYQVLDVTGKLHDGCTCPFDLQDVLKHYKDMVTLNVSDDIFYNIQRQGRISFYIQNQGEEATQFGSGLALKAQDHIFGQYRELGVLYCKGFSYDDALAQLFSTKEDEGKGRQMPISYCKRGANIHAICTPLTSQLPHASGAGYAFSLQKKDAVAVTYFGEGAASEGDFHAALNFAATHKSQSMFMCRNNGYAISTPVHDQYAGDGIAIRGVAYGMPTIRVDGNDLFACYIATKACREICVKESIPVCMEFMTYRVGHHSTSDESSQYRGPGELEAWTNNGVNPLIRLKLFLESKGLWDDEKDKELKKSAKSMILAKIRHHEKVKSINIVDGIFDDVYYEEPWHIREQRQELQEHLSRNISKYNVEKFDVN